MNRAKLILYFGLTALALVLLIGSVRHSNDVMKNAIIAKFLAAKTRHNEPQYLDRTKPKSVKIQTLQPPSQAKAVAPPSAQHAVAKATSVATKPADTLLAPLTRYALNKTIFVTLVDLTCVDLAKNLYEFSYKPLKITNYLFVCANKEACEILAALGINSHFEFDDPKGDKVTNFFSPGYHRKVNLKLQMARRSLDLGFNIILADADIVLFRDPREYLRTFCAGDADVCFQAETGGTVNSGFYFAKATPGAKMLLRNTENDGARRLKTMPHSNDQITIQGHIGALGRAGKLKIRKMPHELFSHGQYWWDVHMRGIYPNRSATCYMLHNNFIISFFAKVYRFKELRFWEVNDGDYYRQTDIQYFTYVTSYAPGTKGGDQRNKEIQELRKALVFGKIFNRTLILPPFHCPQKPSNPCPITSLLMLHRYEPCFTNSSFRDSQFLSNRFVPEKFRRDPPLALVAKELDFNRAQKQTLPEKYGQYLSNEAQAAPVISVSNMAAFVNDTLLQGVFDRLFKPGCFVNGFLMKL